MRMRASRLSLESWPRRLGLPLDFLPFAAAAYSTRLLRSNYTGGAIIGRRSTDNDQTVIGFDANGLLDAARLLDFAGAGSVFVTTWYDQSGNGRDAVQSIAANQPRIVNSGVVDTSNGRPLVRFTGGTVRLSTANFACGVSQFAGNVVGFANSHTAAGRFMSLQSSTDGNDFTTTASAGIILLSSTNQFGGYRFPSGRSQINATITSPTVLTAVYGAASDTIFANGNAGSTVAGSAALGAQIAITLGSQKDGAAPLNGSISEALWFHSALSTTDRQLLERNQGAYYGIAVA